MTEYADKDICERLRRLSGWIDTFAWYNGDAIEFEGEAGYEGSVYENTMQYDWSTDIPAYTLAFILDKLPPVIQEDGKFIQLVMYMQGDGTVHLAYQEPYDPEHRGWYITNADKPVNAAALLACTLFEKGVLERVAQNGKGE